VDCQTDSLCCQHCSKKDQFVSHGFVYKKQFHGKTRTVDKRLFCSSRHGRSGCGRTARLYLATELSRLHYTATHLTVFLLALLAGHSTIQAYQGATQTTEPMILRESSIRALSNPMLEGSHLRPAEEAVPKARQALIKHVESGPSNLRLRALEGLRKPFELDREWLLFLTEDEGSAIAKEAWRQMKRKFGEKISLRDKWRLNPRSFSKDTARTATTIVVIMGCISIGLGVFTAVIVPFMILMSGTGKAVLTAIVVFIAASISALAIFGFGFITILAFGMSHGGSSHTIPWGVIVAWFVSLAIYWVVLVFMARYGYRLAQRNEENSAWHR